jgi:hypothetical protein
MSKNLKWALVLFLWIYIIWRAYTVPITHDEAYSFLMVKTNYINAMVGTANNHWLNSLGMKIGSLFSDHPFALRLFSMIAWLLYGYSAIGISDRINNKIAGFTLLAALTLNPFLLDFFSLARGYGLACAFALASIWKLIGLVEKKDWDPDRWVSVVMLASLSVLSNYTSLYFFLSLTAVYVGALLLNKQWQLFRMLFKSRWIWIVVGTNVIAIANLLFIKLYTGDLEYGGPGGFVDSLFGSLVKGSFYFLWNEQLATIFTFCIAGLVLISLLTALIHYIRSATLTPFVFISVCLLGILLLNALFHIAFGTPYLLSRTTLILYPVIILMLFYFFKAVPLSLQWRNYLSIGLGLPAMVLFALHFSYAFNTTYCYEWKEQADTKKCLDILVKKKAQRVLVHRWHSGVLTNYYRIAEPKKYAFSYQYFLSEDLQTSLEQNRTAIDKYDYAILLPPYDLRTLQQKGIPFTVLQHFPISDAVVLKLGTLNENE